VGSPTIDQFSGSGNTSEFPSHRISSSAVMAQELDKRIRLVLQNTEMPPAKLTTGNSPASLPNQLHARPAPPQMAGACIPGPYRVVVVE
jgi:hypothetical protein